VSFKMHSRRGACREFWTCAALCCDRPGACAARGSSEVVPLSAPSVAWERVGGAQRGARTTISNGADLTVTRPRSDSDRSQ
jgi:hypothetical protein